MSYNLSEKEVQSINNNHKHYYQIHTKGNPYVSGVVIYSRLVKLVSSTLYLEIYIPEIWRKPVQETAVLFLNYWINNNKDLQYCGFYDVKLIEDKALKFDALTTKNFNEFIDFIAQGFRPSTSNETIYSLTNKSSLTGSLKAVLTRSKHLNINTTIFKLLIDIEIQAHKIDLKDLLRLYVYNEKEFYSSKIIGVPSILEIEYLNNTYLKYPNVNTDKLLEYRFYSVIKLRKNKDEEINKIKQIKTYKIRVNRESKLIQTIDF